MGFCNIRLLKFIALHWTMFIKRQTLSIVNSPLIRSVSNIKMNFLDSFFLWGQDKLLKSMLFCTLHSFMSSIKRIAPLFPLFAASEISDSARSASCSIPCANAQHLASVSMASASPRATQSSRSATAFGWFCGTPFPSISRIASSLFASMSPCPTRTSSSSTLCAFTSFLSVICVLFLVFCCFWREKKRKKGEKSKRKEEKGEKSFFICVFGLLEWLLFFFSFLPNHSSFLSLPSLLSLCSSHPFLSKTPLTQTGQEGMDTKWANTLSHSLFPHSHHHFPFFCILVPINLPSQHSFTLVSRSCSLCGKALDAHAIFVSQTHTGMDGRGDNICTALPQHTITTLSLSHQSSTSTQTPKHYCCITHICGHENEQGVDGIVNGWHGNTQNSLIHQPFTLLFNPLQSPFHFNSIKHTHFMFVVLNNCNCEWLKCEEEKSERSETGERKADVNHVLFGKDSETTDGGWTTLRKALIW